MLGENSSPPFPGRYHMAAASIRRREIAGNSIKRARRVEMESIARRVVLPLVKEKCEPMTARDRVLVSSQIVGLPRSNRSDMTIDNTMQFMPSLAAEFE